MVKFLYVGLFRKNVAIVLGGFLLNATIKFLIRFSVNLPINNKTILTVFLILVMKTRLKIISRCGSVWLDNRG